MPGKPKPDQIESGEFTRLSWMGVGLVLVSAASICFEINLTRLFSIAQFYHFAFMVVSIALLGFGASGTYLALKSKPSTMPMKERFPFLAAASSACMLFSYLLVNTAPFDSFRLLIDPAQIARLLLHYVALASPFFFVGLMIGTLLRDFRESSAKVYALNLIGSAVGCLVSVMAPSWVGGEGMVALSAGMAALAGGIVWLGRWWNNRKGIRKISLPLLLSVVLMASSLILGFQVHAGKPPKIFQLILSPYKSLSYALQNPEAQVVSSAWNSISKVEVVHSPSLHAVPGLSYRYLEPLPPIKGLFVDGDHLNPIFPSDADIDFADHLPVALAYDWQPRASVLILEPMGGMAVLGALASGAQQVTAVEGNALVIHAASAIYTSNRVQAVNASGRSFLGGSRQLFDIIYVPLTESYHPVSSGAYSLGENYHYTVEAVADMLDSLTQEGILVMTRWLQEEPSEWLRTFTLTVTALEEAGGDPATQIIALRGYNTGSLFIKKSVLTEDEISAARVFAREKAFDLVFCPSLTPAEVNRFNVLPEPVYFQTFAAFLEATPREAFYRDYPYDVRPPTDNHPFFNHYFKWAQLGGILQTLGHTWQPFGGAGFLVILLILALAFLLSGILILLPPLTAKRRGRGSRHQGMPLYFGLIGLAFLLVEMPLIQQFILFLDHPAYALTAVLFCLFLFSGLGSRYGVQKLAPATALFLLVGLLTLMLFSLPPLIHAALGLPLGARLGITIILIAPLGFLMGIPFPGGLARLRSSATVGADPAGERWRVAWVWAVNGACSVLASILASLLALSLGFRPTLAVGVVCYLLAGVVLRKNKALSPS